MRYTLILISTVIMLGCNTENGTQLADENLNNERLFQQQPEVRISCTQI